MTAPFFFIHPYWDVIPAALAAFFILKAALSPYTTRWVLASLVCLNIEIGLLQVREMVFFRNGTERTNIALWEDNVSKAPFKARPRIQWGAALQRNGDFDAAIQEYRNALTVSIGKPNQLSARHYAALNMASLLIQAGEFQEAKNVLIPLWNNEFPGSPGLASRLSIVLLHDYEAAVQANEIVGAARIASIALDVLNAGIANMDGDLYSGLRLLGIEWQIHFNKGIVLQLLGRCDEALATFEYARTLRSDFPPVPECQIISEEF